MANLLTSLLFLALSTSSLVAKDLGSHGSLFPVLEEDLLAYIKSRLKILDEVTFRERFLQRCQKHIHEPAPVQGLSEAKVPRTFFFDPTITVLDEITNHENQVIVQKGTTVNPLSVLNLSENLIFLDGSKASHLEWAKKQIKAKWILIRGRPLELEERLDRPLYFDQGGILRHKLGIKHIPALVTQEGQKLKIDEIPMDDSK